MRREKAENRSLKLSPRAAYLRREKRLRGESENGISITPLCATPPNRNSQKNEERFKRRIERNRT